MGRYARPLSLEGALERLGDGRWMPLAGGTDIYPAHVVRALDDDLLDLTAIDELRGIAGTPRGYRIGALATWTELARSALPPCFDGLKQAATQIGGRQIQNVATIVGNVCNASPAADGIPVLMTLEAEVELRSANGMRTLPIHEFVRGNRRTARRRHELVTAITIPHHPTGSRSGFVKLGARSHLVISISMVALRADLADDGVTVDDAAVAVGSCAASARRLPRLEARLRGHRITDDAGDLVDGEVTLPLAPIDDVRASAAYRLEASRVLARRAIERLRPEATA